MVTPTPEQTRSDTDTEDSELDEQDMSRNVPSLKLLAVAVIVDRKLSPTNPKVQDLIKIYKTRLKLHHWSQRLQSSRPQTQTVSGTLLSTCPSLSLTEEEPPSVPSLTLTEDHVDIPFNRDGPGVGPGSQPSPSNRGRHAHREQNSAFVNMLSPESDVETSQLSLFDTTAGSPIFTVSQTEPRRTADQLPSHSVTSSDARCQDDRSAPGHAQTFGQENSSDSEECIITYSTLPTQSSLPVRVKSEHRTLDETYGRQQIPINTDSDEFLSISQPTLRKKGKRRSRLALRRKFPSLSQSRYQEFSTTDYEDFEEGSSNGRQHPSRAPKRPSSTPPVLCTVSVHHPSTTRSIASTNFQRKQIDRLNTIACTSGLLAEKLKTKLDKQRLRINSLRICAKESDSHLSRFKEKYHKGALEQSQQRMTIMEQYKQLEKYKDRLDKMKNELHDKTAQADYWKNKYLRTLNDEDCSIISDIPPPNQAKPGPKCSKPIPYIIKTEPEDDITPRHQSASGELKSPTPDPPKPSVLPTPVHIKIEIPEEGQNYGSPQMPPMLTPLPKSPVLTPSTDNTSPPARSMVHPNVSSSPSSKKIHDEADDDGDSFHSVHSDMDKAGQQAVDTSTQETGTGKHADHSLPQKTSVMHGQTASDSVLNYNGQPVIPVNPDTPISDPSSPYLVQAGVKLVPLLNMDSGRCMSIDGQLSYVYDASLKPVAASESVTMSMFGTAESMYAFNNNAHAPLDFSDLTPVATLDNSGQPQDNTDVNARAGQRDTLDDQPEPVNASQQNISDEQEVSDVDSTATDNGTQVHQSSPVKSSQQNVQEEQNPEEQNQNLQTADSDQSEDGEPVTVAYLNAKSRADQEAKERMMREYQERLRQQASRIKKDEPEHGSTNTAHSQQEKKDTMEDKYGDHTYSEDTFTADEDALLDDGGQFNSRNEQEFNSENDDSLNDALLDADTVAGPKFQKSDSTSRITQTKGAMKMPPAMSGNKGDDSYDPYAEDDTEDDELSQYEEENSSDEDNDEGMTGEVESEESEEAEDASQPPPPVLQAPSLSTGEFQHKKFDMSSKIHRGRDTTKILTFSPRIKPPERVQASVTDTSETCQRPTYTSVIRGPPQMGRKRSFSELESQPDAPDSPLAKIVCTPRSSIKMRRHSGSPHRKIRPFSQGLNLSFTRSPESMRSENKPPASSTKNKRQMESQTIQNIESYLENMNAAVSRLKAMRSPTSNNSDDAKTILQSGSDNSGKSADNSPISDKATPSTGPARMADRQPRNRASAVPVKNKEGDSKKFHINPQHGITATSGQSTPLPGDDIATVKDTDSKKPQMRSCASSSSSQQKLIKKVQFQVPLQGDVDNVPDMQSSSKPANQETPKRQESANSETGSRILEGNQDQIDMDVKQDTEQAVRRSLLDTGFQGVQSPPLKFADLPDEYQLSVEELHYERGFYTPRLTDLHQIFQLPYHPDDEELVEKAFQQLDRQGIGTRTGVSSLFYAVAKQIPELHSAGMMRQQFCEWASLNIDRISNFAVEWLNSEKETSVAFVKSLRSNATVPTALTVMVLAMYLEVNITIVTPTREWTFWPSEPQEVVLGFNGGVRFFASIDKEGHTDADEGHASENRCVGCQHQASSFADLRVHIATVHQMLRIQCYKCGNYCPTSTALQEHILIHHHTEGYVSCHSSTGDKKSNCPKSGVTDSETSDAQLAHTKDTDPHDKSNVHNVDSKRQLRSDSMEGTSSRVKGKAMPTSSKIGRARVAPSQKSFLCSVCGFSMRTNQRLQIHLRRHSNDKPYGCQICPDKFCTKSECKRHFVYKHTAGLEIPCPKCGSTFKTRENLKHHLNEKHELKEPLWCHDCERKFNYRQTYLDHMEKVHNKERKLPPRK